MAKRKVLPLARPPAWKCPSCGNWTRDPVGIRCAACLKTKPIAVVGDDHDGLVECLKYVTRVADGRLNNSGPGKTWPIDVS